MTEQRVEIEIVEKRKIGLTDIQQAALSALANVTIEGTAANMRAKEAGIDAASLQSATEKYLSFKPSGAGIGSVDVVLIALGPVAWDLWRYVVLPHIRDKWGDHAIKAKNASARATAKKAKQGNSK